MSKKKQTVGDVLNQALYDIEIMSRLYNHPHISIDLKVKGGQPCIKGTRLTVASILDRLAVHGSIDAVVKLFARNNLTSEQVKAALLFASDDVARDKPTGGGERR